jgi:enoyl-CoA hydratase/carnithine racemase
MAFHNSNADLRKDGPEPASPAGEDDILRVDRDGAIEIATLNRPSRLNALNHPMVVRLLEYFESKRRDEQCRVVLIRGAGRGFCSGADLQAAGEPDQLQDGPTGDWVLTDLMKAMRGCPQPIIALVHGAAAGGGLAMALASDVILAGDSAAFHPSFIRIGLAASELGVAWRLQRTIGISAARAMLLTGRPMLAGEALRLGLAYEMVPDKELLTRGLGLAAEMLRAAPDALRISKRGLDGTLEIADFASALEYEERGQMLMVRQRGRPNKADLPAKACPRQPATS